MAEAAAEGVGQVAAAAAELYQVPELVHEAALQRTGAAKARAAFAHIPVAGVDHLARADAIIIGTPTRFGNMCAQMRNFSVRPALCGPRVHWPARSAVFLPARGVGTADKKPRWSASTGRSCITA